MGMANRSITQTPQFDSHFAFMVVTNMSRFRFKRNSVKALIITCLLGGVSVLPAPLSAQSSNENTQQDSDNGADGKQIRDTSSRFESLSQDIDSLIIKFQSGKVEVNSSGKLIGAERVPSVELSSVGEIGFGFSLAKLKSPISLERATAVADELSKSNRILLAVPNTKVYSEQNLAHSFNLNDSVEKSETIQTSPIWNLDRIDQTSNVLNSRYVYESTGSGVDVYVVDSGIRSTHSEFSGRVSGGVSYVSDGLGTGDCSGHGTHVAGTIGGTQYGVAKEVRLIPVRVFPCTGGADISTIVSALSWISANRAPGRPSLVNMSLGASANTVLDNAVQDLINLGIPVVVSAGNDAGLSCSKSPARVPDAITVNNSTIDDQYNYLSNWGSCSDIYAPGTSILSAGFESDNQTLYKSGTSMAAPHVAGAVALLLSRNPSMTPAQVWSRLDASSTYVNFDGGLGDPNKLLYVGSGFLPPTVPSTPQLPSVVAGIGSATVTWTASASNGGAAIDLYAANAYLASNNTFVGQCATTGTTCTISGLTNGTAYLVNVWARNSVGWSSPTNLLNVTPVG